MKILFRTVIGVTLNLILVISCDKKTHIKESLNIDPVELICESKEEVICYLGVPMNFSIVDIEAFGNLNEYQSSLYNHKHEKIVLEMMWHNDEYGTIVIWFDNDNIAIDCFYWSDMFEY